MEYTHNQANQPRHDFSSLTTPWKLEMDHLGAETRIVELDDHPLLRAVVAQYIYYNSRNI